MVLIKEVAMPKVVSTLCVSGTLEIASIICMIESTKPFAYCCHGSDVWTSGSIKDTTGKRSVDLMDHFFDSASFEITEIPFISLPVADSVREP